MNFSYLRENLIKLPTLIIGLFLILGITFVSCDVNQTEDETELVDIHSQKAQLDNKFGDLSDALRGMDQAKVTPKIFKEAALKHFAGVEKGDKNFSEVSANYDASYRQATLGNLGNKLKNQSSSKVVDNGAIAKLTSKIETLDSYEKANRVFDRFYSNVKNEDNYSVEEKNNLLSTAVFYQATLDFLSKNHELFRLTNNSATKVADVITSGDGEEEDDCGWWESWGKCVAGTVGGAISGGLVGCGASAVPTAGFGCPAGAAVGVVGGGLTGAAEYCDGCS